MLTTPDALRLAIRAAAQTIASLREEKASADLASLRLQIAIDRHIGEYCHLRAEYARQSAECIADGQPDQWPEWPQWEEPATLAENPNHI